MPNFLEFLRLHQKQLQILHCITGQNFKRTWLHLVGYGQKKHREAAKNLKFERHLKTWELHIRHKMKLIYMIYAQICTNHHTYCLQKMRLSIRRERGRRDGILKLRVKVSLKFGRSFGDLLHINPQKRWPNWYGSLLIITSPSTSSYSVSLFFLNTDIQNHFCRLKNLVRLVLSILFLVT